MKSHSRIFPMSVVFFFLVQYGVPLSMLEFFQEIFDDLIHTSVAPGPSQPVDIQFFEESALHDVSW